MKMLELASLALACTLSACSYQAQTAPSVPIEVIPPPTTAVVAPSPAVTKLVLTPSGAVNRYGNPLYDLTVIVNGAVVANFPTVSGRAHTQNRDRHLAGTEAPLPNGRYRVSTTPRASSEHEVGGMFLDITPMFKTGRSALGFHVDPSYNKNKKEDGTAGCIGTTTVSDRNALYRLIAQYKIQLLEVSI